MAENENTTPAQEKEKVTVSIPRGDTKADPNLFVSVNGVNYLLPRGKKSTVPAHVAAEIERSERARDRFEDSREAKISKIEL